MLDNLKTLLSKKSYLFLFIIIIASVLRLWQLGNVPPSPDWDEASLGYNAYSILKTGRDEYGEFMPIILRSFDDYKPALYVYLAIPSIVLFGLNTFAVRLPSVIFGVLTVIATYFLVKEVFSVHLGGRIVYPVRKSSGVKHVDSLALLSSFLLAISPWHLQFSRIAFESNVGLSLNIFTILFFLKGLKNHWLMLLAALFVGLNLHVYQSEKAFVPLLVLVLLIIFRSEVLKLPKWTKITSMIIGIVIALPLVWFIVTEQQALLRARGVSIFADETPFLSRTVERLIEDKKNNDVLGRVLDNRRVTYFVAGLAGYISHFDLNWLFITGDQPRHHAPNMSLLYLFELPFLLMGFYYFIFGPFSKKTKYFLLAWFFITPIPASITSGVPHPIRTLNFLPLFQVFIAIGILYTVQKFSNEKIKYLFITCLSLFALFNFSYYFNQYFVQQNKYNSQVWQYGYKEAISEIQTIEERFDRIVVTNKPYLDQSYIFFLFYLKYDPVLYQKEGGTVSGGFAQTHRGFSKYEFRPIEWDKEEKGKKILFIGRPDDFPDNAKVIKIINFLDGSPAIKIVEG